LTWQPELWRRLVAAVDAPPPDVRHEQTVARLRAGEGGDLPLPDRLSLFGPTPLGVAEVGLRAALAPPRERHLSPPPPAEAPRPRARRPRRGRHLARAARLAAAALGGAVAGPAARTG